MLLFRRSFVFAIVATLFAFGTVFLLFTRRLAKTHASQDAFGVVPVRTFMNGSLANETLGVGRCARLSSHFSHLLSSNALSP